MDETVEGGQVVEVPEQWVFLPLVMLVLSVAAALIDSQKALALGSVAEDVETGAFLAAVVFPVAVPAVVAAYAAPFAAPAVWAGQSAIASWAVVSALLEVGLALVWVKVRT